MHPGVFDTACEYCLAKVYKDGLKLDMPRPRSIQRLQAVDVNRSSVYKPEFIPHNRVFAFWARPVSC